MDVNDTVARTSVNQGPSGGTNYPFSENTALAGSVLDAYVSYEDVACAFRLPFTLSVAGDIWTVTDADTVTVFTGDTADAVSRTWGTRTVWEWKTTEVVFRAVVATGIDGSGVLDARTCNRIPARVRSLRVGLVKASGGFKFRAGYNMAISGSLPVEPADGGRFRCQINIDAVAGAGAGRVNGCEELVPVLRKINQQGPDCSGNFRIEVDPCFRIGPPLLITGNKNETRTAIHAASGLTSDEAKHALRMTSDCQPCCKCDYFVRTYRGLKRQWAKWRDLAVRAEAVRDTYELNRARWNVSRDCRINNPARLILTTDSICKTAIGGSFCNFTSCCLTQLEVRYTFQRYKNGSLVPWVSGSVNDAYISGSATDGDERYAPLQSGPVVRFFMDYANPQDSTVTKFKFCTTDCQSDESLEVTMSVHIPDAAGNTESGDPCTMAEVQPPEWLTDIWDSQDVPATPTVRALLVKTAALNPLQPRFNCEC